MDPLSVQPELLARARRAYEWARVKRALLGVLPLTLLIGPALAFTTRVVPTAALAVALVLGSAGLLWLGRGFPRAALLGVTAGTLPLAVVLCTARIGHACAGAWCMHFCFTTSALGGAAAGVLVGARALTKGASPALLVTSSAFGLMTGAMASTCVGATGFVALVLGFGAGLLGQWLRRRSS